MTYKGKVKNGVVVLDRRARLPEGTAVTVRTLKAPGSTRKTRKPVPSLYDRMKPFIGLTEDLPPDFSINHDHYLYGSPKRK